MTRAKPDYHAAFDKLRQSYLKRLSDSAAALDAFTAKPGLGREDLISLRDMAHGLVGSGAVFGFPGVTETGRKLEALMIAAIKALPAITPASDIAGRIGDLKNACAQAADNAAPSPAAEGAATPQRKANKEFNAILVDDDRHFSDMIGLRLLQKGVRMTSLHDGRAAVRHIEQQNPNLVILDLKMPGISGHEILRALKANEGTKDIPVLMLTASADEKDVLSVLNAGALGYIVKSLPPEALADRLEKYLGLLRPMVLVADNDLLILQLLHRRYAENGVQALVAEDGRKALDMILKNLPSLVVLDRAMPGMTGPEVLAAMRADKKTAAIPVIMLSAFSSDAEIAESLEAGAQACITKPFLPEELIARSMKLIKGADE